MKKKYFDLIKEIPEKELIISLYFTQILLLTIAFFLGLFLFDSYSAFLTYLIGWILIFCWSVEPQANCGFSRSCLDENIAKKYYDDGGLNERIFQKRPFHQIAVIAAVVAIGEEILFRGVIQTHFGLIASA